MLTGEVLEVRGLVVDVGLPDARAPVPGELVTIGAGERRWLGEVALRVGRGHVRVALYDDPWGLRLRLPAVCSPPTEVPAGAAALGRVLDPLGRPLDEQPEVDGPRRPLIATGTGSPLLLSRPLPESGAVGAVALPRGGVAALPTDDRADPAAALLAGALQGGAAGVWVGVGWPRAVALRALAQLQAAGVADRVALILATADTPPALRARAWNAGAALAAGLLASGREVVLVHDGPERHEAAGLEVAELLGRGAKGLVDADPDPPREGRHGVRLTLVERLPARHAPHRPDEPMIGRMRAIASVQRAVAARHADAVLSP